MAIPRPRYNSKRKRKSGKFKQGEYIPKMNESGTPLKYRPPSDTLMNNKLYPFMRSSWEFVFAKFLDNNDNVQMWSTEPFAIPYISPKDGKPHRYYVDFVFTDISNNKFLVEIKPNSQKKCPINLAKWEAAESHAKQINAEFWVVTEVELKKWKLL